LCRLDQQYAASKLLLSLAGVAVRQHSFRRPVYLHLNNLTSQVVSSQPFINGEGAGVAGGLGSVPAGPLRDSASEAGDEFGDFEDGDGDRFASVRQGNSGAEASPSLESALAGAAAASEAPGTASSAAPAGKVLQFDHVA
jgi:hypothetical protein